MSFFSHFLLWSPARLTYHLAFRFFREKYKSQRVNQFTTCLLTRVGSSGFLLHGFFPRKVV